MLLGRKGILPSCLFSEITPFYFLSKLDPEKCLESIFYSSHQLEKKPLESCDVNCSSNWHIELRDSISSPFWTKRTNWPLQFHLVICSLIQAKKQLPSRSLGSQSRFRLSQECEEKGKLNLPRQCEIHHRYEPCSMKVCSTGTGLPCVF